MVETDRLHSLIQAVEQASSSAAIIQAVRELASLRSELALPTLITVLGYNNPGAAVAAVSGLTDLGALAVPALLEQLDDYNYGARAWAIRALAGIGDLRALDTLLAAASSDFALSVRRAATRGLGNLQWSALEAEQLSATQARVMQVLLAVTRDEEWVVRYAAVASLQRLLQTIATTSGTDYPEDCLKHLEQMAATDQVLVVRARSQLACQRLNLP